MGRRKSTRRKSSRNPRLGTKKSLGFLSRMRALLFKSKLRSVGVVFGFGVLVTLVTFLFVDMRVQARLKSRGVKVSSGIYSDATRITPANHIPVPQLETSLKRRGYIGVSTSPEKEGEYRIDSGVLTFKTRAFELTKSRVIESVEIVYGPNPGQIRNVRNGQDQTFFLEPELLQEFSDTSRRASQQRTLSDIPKSMQLAVIATEDQRFYSHFGIDILGLFRALLANLRAMAFVQGGSTLTQQLAKNLFFSPQKTILRKVLELFAAVSLEWRLSKEQILELYLNEVYLGQDGSVAIHGVGEAAHAFFGKDLIKTTLSEQALLAGIIQAPSYYSPRKHLNRALKQRDMALQRMLEAKFISPAQLTKAESEEVRITKSRPYPRRIPHYADTLRQDLETKLDLESSIQAGLTVRSGINLDLQSCAESAISAGLVKIEKEHPRLAKREQSLEAALLSIEPFSAKIRAWVGGRNFAANQFDHVNSAQRQVGSTIKPFLYLTAIDPNLNTYRPATPISILPDRPLTVELARGRSWEPQNYDKKFRGDVTLRYALERSLNSPAVFVATKVGLAAFTRTVEAFRVADEVPEVPAVTLGALDTNLLKLTAAYGALANGGNYISPRLFVSATDASGEPLLYNDLSETRVANEGAVFILTNILQGVIERGTGRVVRSLGFEGAAAAKTGTSDQGRNSWFLGYTPNLVTGVWVGFDDNSETDLTGATGAAPIWAEYMKCAAPFIEESSFIRPPNVIFRDIDSQSGALATRECPREDIIQELFLEGTEPRSACPIHGGYGDEFDRRPPPPREEERRRKRSLWEILFG